MNICIINIRENNPYIGGVERVSYLLGQYWINNGQNVIFLSCYKSNIQKSYFTNCKELFLPDAKNIFSEENIAFSTEIMIKYNIDVIINQGSVFKDLCKLCECIKLNTQVKLVTTIHYSLLCKFKAIKNNFFIKYKLGYNYTLWIKDFIYWFRFLLYKQRNFLKSEIIEYNQIAQCSDVLICLSESYVKEYKSLINPIYHHKLFAITNPIELKDSINISKNKQILYVGRLEFGMKRFDRLLKIWSKTEQLFPDWSLVVVGDGPYRQYFESIVNNLGLKRIFFEGFQNPEEYYLNSSIICLTSTTEGFGMVLIEALQHKCIPIAYNSFGALSDIIIDNVNGYSIPPFNEKIFVEKLQYLMSNADERERLAANNAVTLDKFDINKVSQQWLDLFDNLLK
ncbi:MAG: glycosyltransferase [Bacteroidales bacterium]|nr:glycosyltransferase [Bacteroidales bacterium]